PQGTKFILENPKTQQKVEVNVVRPPQMNQEGSLIPVEFLSPAPLFWNIVFPPNINCRSDKRRHPACHGLAEVRGRTAWLFEKGVKCGGGTPGSSPCVHPPRHMDRAQHQAVARTPS